MRVESEKGRDLCQRLGRVGDEVLVPDDEVAANEAEAVLPGPACRTPPLSDGGSDVAPARSSVGPHRRETVARISHDMDHPGSRVGGEDSGGVSLGA